MLTKVRGRSVSIFTPRRGNADPAPDPAPRMRWHSLGSQGFSWCLIRSPDPPGDPATLVVLGIFVEHQMVGNCFHVHLQPVFSRGMAKDAESQPKGAHANHSTAHPQGSREPCVQEQVHCPEVLPTAPWRVHQGVHHHPEEAELGPSQGGQGASGERLRGDRLHRR